MKLFLAFSSQEQRRSCGGSCFLELQYCPLPPQTPVRKLVDPNAIAHWKPDSVYVRGDAPFYDLYRDVLGPGITADGHWSGFDNCGLNYYPPEQIPGTRQRLLAQKPPDHQSFLSWLENSEKHNGFYILGL